MQDGHDDSRPRPGPTVAGRVSATPVEPRSPSRAWHAAETSAHSSPTHTVAGGDQRAHARAFHDGQLLAGRFQVLGLLGTGGMGEVYAAEDLELHERVALKTIRGDLGNARANADFLREIHLARKVTHGNVCRIYDLFHHVDGSSGSDTAFLSMELLEGETLSQRLRRQGRLSAVEALPLLRQLAAGLDAAHARGIVHRDFKPGNVILVGGGPTQPGARAVITDFGLARAEASDEGGHTLSNTGVIVGTPAYMAPEQVTGAALGPAADIYAFGIVTYELLTGRAPFGSESVLATAVKRLTEAPVAPRRLAAELSGAWEAAILRCLEREPARRFASAGAFVQALERPDRSRSWLTGALVAGAVLAGLGLLQARAPRRAAAPPALATPTPAASATAVKRRAVAVLGFRNLSNRPESAWVSTALSEMLASELAAGGTLRLVSGENVARVRLDLGLAEADALADDALARVRRSLASDLVVLGSYLALGDKAGGRLRLDLRVHDARSGEALETLIENGTEADLPTLVARCGTRLRAVLGAGAASAGETRAARAAFATDPLAARAYAEGLACLRRYDASGARDRLLEAASAAPRQALVHAALADAWELLGYQGRARDAARRALELAPDLAREHRLLVEARYKEHAFDWAGAMESYRTLWGFFPDSLDYGLRFVVAQANAGHANAAPDVLAALRRLPAPDSEDPRIDIAEARVATALSEFPRAAAAADRAARKGRSAGARVIVAEARLHQAWALFQLGQATQVLSAAREAERLFAEAGNRSGVADAVQLRAHVAWMQGDLAGAEPLYAEAVTAYRLAGNRRGTAQALLNSAGLRSEQGDLRGARQVSEQTLPVFREIGDKTGETAALNNLAGLLLQMGNLPAARQNQTQALALARATRQRSAVAQALHGFGDAHRIAGDLPAARAHYEQALQMRIELDEPDSLAATRLKLARLLLEEGRAAEAVQAVQVALAVKGGLRAERRADGGALLSQALLAAGRGAEAQAQVAQLMQAVKGLGRVTRQSVELAAATVEAQVGVRAVGLERLRLVLVEARRCGQLDLEFEVRRARVRLGAERLEDVARDARARGMGLYALRGPAQPPASATALAGQ